MSCGKAFVDLDALTKDATLQLGADWTLTRDADPELWSLA
jgi:hypothetical protein